MNKILISGLMLVFMLASCFSACSNAQQAGIEFKDNQNGLQMSAATESGDELSQLKSSQSQKSLDIQPSNTSRLDRIATTIKPATTETFPPTQKTNIPTNNQKATPLPTNSPDIDRLDALIQITSPGQGSVVVSPIILDMELDPNDAQTLIVELRDQDGRLLVRQLDSLLASELVTRSFSKVIRFEIREISEPGRLVVSSRDTNGRWVAVNSIDLILNSEGEPQINPQRRSDQPIVIQNPLSGSAAEGDSLAVSGLVWQEIAGPLRVLLITEDGEVVGQRLAGVLPGEGEGYYTFSTEVPYQVTEPTPVRLTVYEDGGVTSPIRHLSSLVLILNP